MGCSRVLTTMTVGRACCATVSGSSPNSGRAGAVDGRGRGAHDHQVGVDGLAQDGRRRRPRPRRSERLRRVASVLRARTIASARSAWERSVGSRSGGTTCRTSTSASKAAAAPSAKRSASSACGPPRTGARMRRTSLDAALLDDRDVAGRSRTTSSMVALKTGSSPIVASPPARPAAPAEDDQVGLLLGGQLHDALRGTSPDAHHGAQVDAVGRELQDPLQQPARLARPRRALGQRHALGHLHDGQRGEHAAVRQQRRPDAHQVGRGPRVGERDEDAAGQARAERSRRGAVATHAARRPASARRSRLGQLEGPRLALHDRLGLLRGHLARLDDEAGDARRSRAARARPRARRCGSARSRAATAMSSMTRAQTSSGKWKSRRRCRSACPRGVDVVDGRRGLVGQAREQPRGASAPTGLRPVSPRASTRPRAKRRAAAPR